MLTFGLKREILLKIPWNHFIVSQNWQQNAFNKLNITIKENNHMNTISNMNPKSKNILLRVADILKDLFLELNTKSCQAIQTIQLCCFCWSEMEDMQKQSNMKIKNYMFNVRGNKSFVVCRRHAFQQLKSNSCHLSCSRYSTKYTTNTVENASGVKFIGHESQNASSLPRSHSIELIDMHTQITTNSCTHLQII